MYKNWKIVAMIPARAGSKRLPNKNIKSLNGRPMLSYAIHACKSSNFIDDLFVSTESEKIGRIAEKYGAKIFNRPKELAEDDVTTQEVMKNFAENNPFDLLVLVQANSPQVSPINIDKGIKLLVDNNLWEVRSINNKGLENGAFWILKRKTIYWTGLSVYFGVIEENALDIHTQEDFDRAEALIKNAN